MPTMTRRTLAMLAIVTMVFVVALALYPTAMKQTAAKQQVYALALSSGPELTLSKRAHEPNSKQDTGWRMVCEYVLDVGVAQIGTRCAPDRRHATIAQR